MKKSNFFWVLAIAMMALTQSVWAIDPHFYLIGSFTGDNWNGDARKAYPINVNYEKGRSKYCIEVDVVNGTTYYFALFNGYNRYAPQGDNNGKNKGLSADSLLNYDVRTVRASQGKGVDAWYKKGDNNEKPQDVGDNSWKITANYTGKLLICVDEENGQEWYPYVWLERPNNYCVIGDAISGISGDFWNVHNSACPLVNKNADGKYYVNLYLKKDSYFALTYGGARFAPSTSPVSVFLNTVKDTVYDGSCTNGQDNSWKYEGETGLVRLVFDATAGTFTLEPWQMCLIGSPAQEQEGEIGKWDVKNTSMPLTTPYVNAEGTAEAGKYYCEVLLNRYVYFAFSDGVLRYANNTASQNKDIKSGDTGQQGTYDKPNNSWKFVEASYVRVCIDYTSSPKPYIWIEEICPKEIFPIGEACTWGWTIENAAPLSRKEGEDQVVYSGKLTLQAGGLKFLCQQSFDKHYGPAENGVAMDAVGEYDITLLSGTDTDNKWQNTLKGEYIVTLNVETLKLTVEKPGTTTLVETTSVFNDNIVYDIMGRALGTSVENLPQGIYVRNGKKFVVAQ